MLFAGAVKTLVSAKRSRGRGSTGDVSATSQEGLVLPGEVAGPFQEAPLSRVYLPAVLGESKREMWDRYGYNVVVTMVQSVQESSQKTYGSGWRRWLAFSNFFGTDP